MEEVSYDTADTPIKSEELLLDEHSIDSTSPSDPLEKVLRTLPPRRNDPVSLWYVLYIISINNHSITSKHYFVVVTNIAKKR